jgi:uridine kinase
MSYCYHHIDKWASTNFDLVEENLESNSKSVVFIAGASSSGKSYCAKFLSAVLEKNGLKPIILSLDNYNVGLSHLIPLKVNQNYYDGKMEHLDEISTTIKPLLMETPFDRKYDEESLRKIRHLISSYFSSDSDLDAFLDHLNSEWKVLNFDEPIVYDMALAAQDVKILLANGDVERRLYSKVYSERIPTGEVLHGKDCDVILVEGIYALNDSLLSFFDRSEVITDFIDGNPKTLFLRRILRDTQITSASSSFTIGNYFKYIIPSYVSTILPSRENADVVYLNDMTFLEKRQGSLYKTKQEIHTNSETAVQKILSQSIIEHITYAKDTYFSTPNEGNPDENVLRLRAYSSDGGKTYQPSSLVHKGIPKIRKDHKIIRPINLLIKEGEFDEVWGSELECISDFARAGFLIGPIQHKIKWKVVYHSGRLTIRKVESKGYYIEFEDPDNKELIQDIQSLIDSEKDS